MRNTLSSLSYKILTIANQEIPRSVFLKEVSTLLLDDLACSELKFLLKVPQNDTSYEFVQCSKDSFNYEIISTARLGHFLSEEKVDLWTSILNNSFDSDSTFFTNKGTFWTINYGNFAIPYRQKLGLTVENNSSTKGNNTSLLIIPFLYSNVRVGLIQLKQIRREIFSGFGTDNIEEFAQTLNAILINQYTQSLLQERVKELAFLYEMANITNHRSRSFEDMIHEIIKLIPAAWQYPEITSAKITIKGIEYSNSTIDNPVHKLESDIIVDDKKVGNIEVVYTEKRPELFEGAFFKEERNLLNNIAMELAKIIK